MNYRWKLKVNPKKKRGKGYDPGQPRVPAGDPRGGQWTATGAVGGGSLKRVEHPYTDWEERKTLRGEIQQWPDSTGDRKRIALSALRDGLPYQDQLKMRYLTIRDGKELVGIATFRTEPMRAAYAGDTKEGYGLLEALATKRAGYGRLMLNEVLKSVRYEGLRGLAVVSTRSSASFYEHLGMKPVIHEGHETGWYMISSGGGG